MTLLNVSDLSHHYAHGGFSGKHQHQAVLNNVSLALKSGETVALLGRSGCGKSTLARLLVGLESPSQGNISWRGEPLARYFLAADGSDPRVARLGNGLPAVGADIRADYWRQRRADWRAR